MESGWVTHVTPRDPRIPSKTFNTQDEQLLGDLIRGTYGANTQSNIRPRQTGEQRVEQDAQIH